MATNEEIRAKDILPHKTSFSAGDGFYGDGNMSFFMEANTLLKLTAQNALAGNVAPEFVPNSTITVAGQPYVFNGSLYMAKEAYQGPWDASKFTEKSVSDFLAELTTKKDYALSQSSLFSVSLAPTETGKYVSNSLVVESGSVFRYLSLPMKSGDKVIITTTNGGSPVVTAFMFAVSGSVTVSGSNRYYENYEFTAPSDGMLYVNGVNNNTFSVVVVGQPQRNVSLIEKLKTDVDSIYGSIAFESGYYNVRSSTTTIPTSRTTEAGWVSTKIQVKAGEKYKVKATGSSAALAFSAYNVNGAAIYKSGNSVSDYEYTVESDGYIIVNSALAQPHYVERVVTRLESYPTNTEMMQNDAVLRENIPSDPSEADVTISCVRTDGGYVQTDGTVYEHSSWHYFTKTVSPGEIYDIRSTSGQSVRGYIFFDTDDNVISYEDPAAAPSVSDRWIYGVLVPLNAVRLVINTSTPLLFALVRRYGNLNVEYTGYNSISDFNEIDVVSSDSNGKVARVNLSSFFGYSVIEIEDNDNWVRTEGYANHGSTDVEDSDWEYFTRSVKPGERFYIKAHDGLYARLWRFTTDDLKTISVADSSAPYEEKTAYLTVPRNATKLIVNNQTHTYGAPHIFVAKKYELRIDSRNLDLSPTIDRSSNRLYGKTLVCCGDSITYGADMDAEGITHTSTITMYERSGVSFVEKTSNFYHTYGYQVAERNNMLFYNDGISGSTVEDIENHNGFSKANGRYTTLPDNIDYLTLWFGWNDSAYGTLGEITDEVRTTFYGAYNIVLPYLIAKYPYTKICLCVPFGPFAGIRQAVRDLGNKWGLAVFDFYGPQTPLYYGKEDSVGVDASIVTANRTKFQANGAHPNFKGHRQLADMLEAFLRTI